MKVEFGFTDRVRLYRKAMAALGPKGFIDRSRANRTGNSWVRTPLSDEPVYVRRGTSDRLVFDQIFVDREYRCIDHLRGIRTVVDAGANVGYSSAYLLTRFPEARALCIEPDASNFRALRQNLGPWGSRVTYLQAALWHEPGYVDIRSDTLGSGQEWGRQVEAADSGSVRAVSMPEIIAKTGQIDLLKIDIEGAEKEVFAGDTSWLDGVGNIVVELHSDEDRRVFFAAIGNRYTISQCEELTVCLGHPNAARG